MQDGEHVCGKREGRLQKNLLSAQKEGTKCLPTAFHMLVMDLQECDRKEWYAEHAKELSVSFCQVGKGQVSFYSSKLCI